MNTAELPTVVKWRGSSYQFVRLGDNGKVYWRNSVSTHEGSCSVEAWKRSDPYDKEHA